MSGFDWQLFDAQPVAIKALVWEYHIEELKGLGILHCAVPSRFADEVAADIRKAIEAKRRRNARRTPKKRPDFSRFVPSRRAQ